MNGPQRQVQNRNYQFDNLGEDATGAGGLDGNRVGGVGGDGRGGAGGDGIECPNRTNFSFANFIPLNEDCDRTDFKSNPACFFSYQYCSGVVTNGLCTVCDKMMCRKLETGIDPVSKYKQIWPVATKAFQYPTFVFPLLSMLGPTEAKNIYLSHEIREVQENAKLFLSKGSQNDTDSAVQRKFVNKMMFFHASHNAFVNRHRGDLNERFIAVHFTKDYKPATKFAKLLYEKAFRGAAAAGGGGDESTTNDNTRSVVVRLLEFGNLLDILNLASFIPSQHVATRTRTHRVVNAFVPNVIVLDGYICYGFGNGVHAPPSEAREYYCGHEIIDSAFAEIKRTTHRVVSPLILDACASNPTNLLQIQNPVVRNNVVRVPSSIGVVNDLSVWTPDAWTGGVPSGT